MSNAEKILATYKELFSTEKSPKVIGISSSIKSTKYAIRENISNIIINSSYLISGKL